MTAGGKYQLLRSPISFSHTCLKWTETLQDKGLLPLENVTLYKIKACSQIEKLTTHQFYWLYAWSNN